MRFIVDSHIHSRYSRATSKSLTPEHLDYWARLKGIDVVGTGDCTHPAWLDELEQKLVPAENGLYVLRDEYRLSAPDNPLPRAVSGRKVYFMLSGEISNIYKKHDKVRKVHNICYFPDIASARTFQLRLERIGNIRSDGRPILGLDARDLLEMVLETAPASYLIPAHIWTPWFSVLGSKSGFDSIEECYEDLSEYVFALETGLSSDPPMNWVCSFLDRFRLVSNSDAHSPEKLGREATIFDAPLSYQGIYDALKFDRGYVGTIEFFPQEGKYFYDGHRKCDICWDPLETLRHEGVCPVCGGSVTRGVLYRVAELADRDDIREIAESRFFRSITPLPELLEELTGKKAGSATVQREYFRLLDQLGPEFFILLDAGLDELRDKGSEKLAEGIRRLRAGEVQTQEGFDGEFGVIRVFDKNEPLSDTGQMLFSLGVPANGQHTPQFRQSIHFDIAAFQELKQQHVESVRETGQEEVPAGRAETDEQRSGIEHEAGVAMVLAGPGSGKTRILTERIVRLVTEGIAEPDSILAVTFSNKAAQEIQDRITRKLGVTPVTVATFHAFGLSILRQHYELVGRQENFTILDTHEVQEVLAEVFGESKRERERIAGVIESYKQGIDESPEAAVLVNRYQETLRRMNTCDLGDLIYLPAIIFKNHPNIAEQYRQQYRWVLVDEYQDINARQYELIKLLTGEGEPNLFVIGDPDQAIYGFRGSDIRFIDRLQEDFPTVRTIRLQQSFRCPHTIIKAAGQTLQKQECLTGIQDSIKVHIQQCETERSEADWIAGRIEHMIGGVRSFSRDSGMSDGNETSGVSSFSDFAVLCRTSALFPPIIQAFQDHGIAYQVIGEEPFFYKEPYRELLRTFRDCYQNKGVQADLFREPVRVALLPMLRERKNIDAILQVLFREFCVNPDEARSLLELGRRLGNNYPDFFRQLSLRQSIDELNVKAEAVSLMTMHASKGLEFNAVFIPGCEERIIPFELFGKKEGDALREEERLMYVGMTRSKKYLFLSHVAKRLFRGSILQQKPSRLLERLGDDLLHEETRQAKRAERQLKLF